MTTQKLCELLEKEFRKKKGTDNKKIVFGILYWVKNRLGEDVLLQLLQQMEKRGDAIAWAVDVTDKSPQEQEKIRIPNGNNPARYYKNCMVVFDRTYLVSSQWYSCNSEQKQTIKELLDMVVEKGASLELCAEDLQSCIQKNNL